MLRACPILLLLFVGTFAWAQGHIDVIKNQKYLELNIDCSCEEDSCATALHFRYCANIAFQQSDSLLTIYYDSLLVLMREFSGQDTTAEQDSIASSFIKIQTEWRNYRRQHCGVFWDDPSCNSNYCGRLYLSCFKSVTDFRSKELMNLVAYYGRQIAHYREDGTPIH